MVGKLKTAKRYIGVAVLVALVFAVAQISSSDAAVGINQQINFMGKVTTPSGTNPADGTYNLRFRIYRDGNNQGTGSTLLWTETRLVSAGNGVTATSGTLQVNLGSVTPFGSNIDWNQDTLWLSMEVGNTSTTPTWDGEMKPYIRFTSVPYALNAGAVSGITADRLVQLNPSTYQNGDILITGDIEVGDRIVTTGVPSAVTTSSLVQVGGAISGGNANGTYIGGNTAAGFTGDLVNLQRGNATMFGVSGGGLVNSFAGYAVFGSQFASSNAGGVSLGNITGYSQNSGTTSIQSSSSTNILATNSASNSISIGQSMFTSLSVTQPTGSLPFRVHWSPNSTYLAVGDESTTSGSEHISIYKRTGDTMAKLTTSVSINATQTPSSVEWSPDSQYLTLTSDTSPYVKIYKRSGDTFTLLSSPTTLPAGGVTGSSWAPNGTYLSLSLSVSPYVFTYKRTTDTFTKLADPAVLPTATINALDWDATSTRLALASSVSPYLQAYTRSGDTLTSVANLNDQPASAGNALAWTNQTSSTSMLVIGMNTAPFVATYGSAYARLPNQPGGFPAEEPLAISWSPDDAYLMIGGSVYERKVGFNGVVNLVRIPGFSDGATFLSFGLSWTQGYVAAGTDQAPGLRIYKVQPRAAIAIDGSVTTSNLNVSSIDSTGEIIVRGLLDARGGISVGVEEDGVITGLRLDRDYTFSEDLLPCASSNRGSMYFSLTSNVVRACLNGSSWGELASVDGLGLIAFGVVPDSPNAGSPGDIGGITPANSPCKVYRTSATAVTVAPCIAYSGGRKVTVPSTALTISGAVGYRNICLDASGVPVALAVGSAEEAAQLPTWSPSSPALCLATVYLSDATTLARIYDVRTFTTSTKTFMSSSTTGGVGCLGCIVVQTTTSFIVGVNGNAIQGNIKGIIVAWNGGNSSTASNVIVATGGPGFVKAAGTSSAGSPVVTAATSASVPFGYTSTTTASTTAGPYSYAGIATRTIDTACSAATNCQYSQFLNPINIR